MDKKELRKEFLKFRNELSIEVRKEKSIQIANRVTTMNEFRNADVVLLYNAIRSEVETTEVFQEAKRLGKRIYCPRVIGDQMEFYLIDETTEFEVSNFGICEPKMVEERRYISKEEDVVFVLIPGAAFDEDGNRVGYGGGYYDKYLKRLQENLPIRNIWKVAVGYECQILDKGCIKAESYDIRCDYIVTEYRMIMVR